MARLPLIFIKCKAYRTVDEMLQLCVDFIDRQTIPKEHFCFILPFLFLTPFAQKFKDTGITLCAEKMLAISENSFPASIAGKMLKKAGAQSVLIGSLEERVVEKEKLSIHEKILKALESNLQPIVAIGETAQEHEEQLSKEVFSKQITESFSQLSAEQQNKLMLLYEAPWINSLVLENAYAAIPTTYSLIKEVLKEIIPSENEHPIATVYAIPSFSTEFFQSLQPFSPAGYYLGTFTELTSQMILPNHFLS
jgi:triosephosphate isomerase (TIM)